MNPALVVIPTYNEKDNVRSLTRAVEAACPEADLLFVDDNSPDGTGQILDELAAADPRLHVLHRPGKQGLGRAYIAGFEWALPRGYQFLCEMDADFSHDPHALPDFMSAIENADLVIGSRYINGITVINWPISRLLLSYFANAYARFVTRMPLRDMTGGFKCFRRDALSRINLDRISSEGYSFQIEMNFIALHLGLRVKEIPIVFRDRQAGTSKMDFRINREAAWMVWKLRLLAWAGRLRHG